MPFILGTNSIKDTGYDVANSLRFNPGSSDTLSRTLSTPTNNKKFTFSFWFKKCENGREQHFVNGGAASSQFYINSSDQLYFYDQTAGGTYKTTQVFRDVSAWMHIVVAEDTTQGTASSRIRIYVNGSEITDFAIETDPTQNNGSAYNTAATHTIGTYAVSPSGYYYSGYLAEFVFVDGQQLAPTDFGEFDSDSPTIWKPKDVSGLTFGNNGFHLDFEDSSALGNDVSGNNNDFSVTNLAATDQSTDTCTNNFATINSLNTHTSINLSEGNLKATGASSSSWVAGAGTIGITKGFPCYWEAKATTSTRLYFGLSRLEEADPVTSTPSAFEGTSVTDYMWRATTANTIFYRGSNLGATISAVSTGDIMACSVDSSGIVKFYNNGSVIYTFSQALIDGFFYFPIFALNNYSSTETIEANFGNPAFSISSGNTDANGYGNFEHAPPANHYALNTKNLSEFG